MNEEELNNKLMKLWNEGKTLKDLNMEHKEGDSVGVGGFTETNKKYYQLSNGEWLPILLKETK